MSYFVHYPEWIGVQCERQPCADGQDERKQGESQYPGIECTPMEQQQYDRSQKKQVNHVVTDYFERGQADPVDIADREVFPIKNAEQNQNRNQRIHRKHNRGFDLAFDEKRSEQKRDAQDISADYIKFGTHVAELRKNAHAFVPKQVQEIKESEKQEADADAKVIVVVQ